MGLLTWHSAISHLKNVVDFQFIEPPLRICEIRNSAWLLIFFTVSDRTKPVPSAIAYLTPLAMSLNFQAFSYIQKNLVNRQADL
jgi:hypothetical protein